MRMVTKEMKNEKYSSLSGNIRKIAHIDPILTASVVLLNLMGLISIRSITEISGSSGILVKQAAGSVIGIILMIAMCMVDTEKITKYWKIIYDYFPSCRAHFRLFRRRCQKMDHSGGAYFPAL